MFKYIYVSIANILWSCLPCTRAELCEIIKDDNIIVVSESGIKDIETIKKLNEKNIKSFLVGESIIKHSDPGLLLESLVG